MSDERTVSAPSSRESFFIPPTTTTVESVVGLGRRHEYQPANEVPGDATEGSSERSAAQVVEPRGGGDDDDGQADTQSQKFLRHITISRDQTKGNRTKEEEQHLKALLDKEPRLRLRPDPRVPNKDIAKPATDQRNTAPRDNPRFSHLWWWFTSLTTESIPRYQDEDGRIPAFKKFLSRLPDHESLGLESRKLPNQSDVFVWGNRWGDLTLSYISRGLDSQRDAASTGHSDPTTSEQCSAITGSEASYRWAETEKSGDPVASDGPEKSEELRDSESSSESGSSEPQAGAVSQVSAQNRAKPIGGRGSSASNSSSPTWSKDFKPGSEPSAPESFTSTYTRTESDGQSSVHGSGPLQQLIRSPSRGNITLILPSYTRIKRTSSLGRRRTQKMYDRGQMRRSPRPTGPLQSPRLPQSSTPMTMRGKANSNSVNPFSRPSENLAPQTSGDQIRRSGSSSQLHADQFERDFSPESEHPDAADEVDVEDRIQRLKAELELLQGQVGGKTGFAPSMGPAPTWQTVYRLGDSDKVYLGRPEWVHGDHGLRLSASTPIRDWDTWVERHGEVKFVVFENFRKEYEGSHLGLDEYSDLGMLPDPEPAKESILILSDLMLEAFEAMRQRYPEFDIVFPKLDSGVELPGPFRFLFYMLPLWEERVAELDEEHQEMIQMLFKFMHSTGRVSRFEEILGHLSEGTITRSCMPYFIRPGEVIVNQNGSPRAFMAVSWPYSTGIFTAKGGRDRSHRKPGKERSSDERRHGRRAREAQGEYGDGSGTEMAVETWIISGWRWSFSEGQLWRKTVTQELRVNPYSDEPFSVDTLEWIPLRYARDEVKTRLKERGEKFWLCKERQFVGYSTEGIDMLENTNERYIVDFATYRRLHPQSKKSQREQKMDMTVDVDILASDVPPQDDGIHLFPSTMIGFNLRLKKWDDIEVDRIQDVSWNKKAFENLVIDEDTKHLVKALISSQIKAEKSTDLISGKGNGLIILLHGGPGTGKTFTAESVAELAEKPLYRVTCGDIGTRPEDVEKYLESVLLLGKIWGCVVLLDEADVFLEERSLTDLKRNALVSVFLRVLEYYEGILILTSNRVGIFDQAFRSRIQLALHYENLTKPQRRKIWRNFFNRLKDLGETHVDFDDLYDHIDELADRNMNGRQIRNAITTARQLAQFDQKDFSHDQLKHVLKVSGKFEGYLKGISGYSEDELARDSGLR